MPVGPVARGLPNCIINFSLAGPVWRTVKLLIVFGHVSNRGGNDRRTTEMNVTMSRCPYYGNMNIVTW